MVVAHSALSVDRYGALLVAERVREAVQWEARLAACGSRSPHALCRRAGCTGPGRQSFTSRHAAVVTCAIRPDSAEKLRKASAPLKISAFRGSVSSRAARSNRLESLAHCSVRGTLLD